ncbi:unnamed protein product [Closterium sp. Yama58-4]|nr:unnamed protein product [Closterium sp. Yama58-4]
MYLWTTRMTFPLTVRTSPIPTLLAVPKATAEGAGRVLGGCWEGAGWVVGRYTGRDESSPGIIVNVTDQVMVGAFKLVILAGSGRDNYSAGSDLTGCEASVEMVLSNALGDGAMLPVDDTAIYFILASPDVALAAPYENTYMCDDWCSLRQHLNFTAWDGSTSSIRYVVIGDASKCPEKCAHLFGHLSSPNGNIYEDAAVNVIARELASFATNPEKDVRGMKLYFQQFKALMIKNALLAWRNRTATFLQLCSSFFFILLIFLVDVSVKAALTNYTEFRDTPNPNVVEVQPIMACENAFNILKPCYDFLWSGNNSKIITSLVQNISANNPGRPINASRILGFANPSDVDVWLLAHPMRTPGALHFAFTEKGDLGFAVQTNSTSKVRRGAFENPTFDHQVPLQAAAEREIARYIAQDWTIGWQPSYSEFAHPPYQSLSAIPLAGPTFLFAAAMFNFVTQAANLVIERELKLRQAMATMGLMDSVFWSTWLVWELLVAFVTCILLICFGMMFQFAFFLKNSFVVLFLVFFLFWVAMTGLAFLVSTFMRKSANANTVGFFIFLLGFVLQLMVMFGFPYTNDFSGFWRVIFSLFPPDLLTLSLKYLTDATKLPESPGVSLSEINKCTLGNAGCTNTLASIYMWLIGDFFIFFILAIYFDNVLPDANGIRKPILYFFYPSFWTGKASFARHNDGKADPGLELVGEEDEDVQEEEERVKGQAERGEVDADVAVSVRGLVKTFPKKFKMKGLKCKMMPPFHAIKGTWFNVEKDKLFCLLGPNGAGKSTTIHCLTGILPTTAGDGLIYGHSIRDPGSMAAIRAIMGVCPQFDILWDRLTSQEHLFLFARIKGLLPSQIPKECAMLLEEVKLTNVTKSRTSGYSGGMKRRLSVAIALIGDPKIVFLDEPTTGMDPVSRRHVWDIMERAKRGRAIVLTTHSMEEADILGDRIAIMAKGRMRCIGTSIHLKNRFGAGFVVTVGVRRPGRVGNAAAAGAAPGGAGAEDSAAETSNGSSPLSSSAVSPDGTPGDNVEAVKGFFYDRLGVQPVEESQGYITFLVPRSKETMLTTFFRELKQKKRELGVTETHLSLSTLEEVFLTIARKAELETAQAEERFEAITLVDGRTLQVPIGAECVAIPPSASANEDDADVDAGQSQPLMVVDITWHQDEAGCLRITTYSEPRQAGSGELNVTKGF